MMSKRQGDHRKQYSIKGEIDSLGTPRNITPIEGSCYEVIDSSISQEIFPYLKMLSTQSRKNIRVKITKIYIPMLYVTRMTQNKNNSINSILRYGRLVDKNCCVVFPASGFPYLILCLRQCKGKVATTYLDIRTKNN